MKISASIYSNKTKKLEELVKELDSFHVDYFHIDCNDDPAVFSDIAAIRKISKTPIDLHIITDRPAFFIPYISQDKTELVAFQLESLPAGYVLPDSAKTRYGFAIKPSTSIDMVERCGDFNFLLFTSETPGRTGDGFKRDNYRNIRSFRNRFPGKPFHVDGGINDELSFVLRNMGINLVVSGSFLVNADFIGSALHRLRNDSIHSEIRISDFMLFPDELPMVRESSSLKEVLESIEHYRLGFTLMVDKFHNLKGLISNADLRRGMMKKIGSLDTLTVEDLVNPEPFCLDENCTIAEMLKEIKSKRFPVMFVPVTDKSGALKGALSFNNLIKGEA
jgi:ribulose-phosphate 3-epimerase